MKAILRKLASAMWKRAHGRVLVIFNYHQVSPAFDPLTQSEYTWTQLDHFRRELEFIKGYFKVLPLHEAIDCLKRSAVPGVCAALTFDDGDISMQQHALPLLKEMSLPATFFINTGHGRGKGYYWFPVANYLQHSGDPKVRALWTDDLKNRVAQLRKTPDPSFYDRTRREVESHAHVIDDRAPLLVDDAWLASLDGEQFTLGAHGHEHQRHRLMPDDWQRDNLRRCVEALSGYKAYKRIFAFPFGRPWDFNEMTIRAALELDHAIVAAHGGLNVENEILIRRIPCDGRSAKEVFQHATTEW
jgi:peptidoglycan/xylan/chitin deacetylase (PgdA/CDA1 family)